MPFMKDSKFVQVIFFIIEIEILAILVANFSNSNHYVLSSFILKISEKKGKIFLIGKKS